MTRRTRTLNLKIQITDLVSNTKANAAAEAAAFESLLPEWRSCRWLEEEAGAELHLARGVGKVAVGVADVAKPSVGAEAGMAGAAGRSVDIRRVGAGVNEIAQVGDGRRVDMVEEVEPFT